MENPGSSQSFPGDVMRDRSIRLFTFLRELTELRTKAIRTIDQYENVLWLNDIPRDPHCFCAGWNLGTEQEPDVWVQLQKPRMVDPPPPPREIQSWVSQVQLRDSSRAPRLNQVLTVEVEDNETGESQTEYRPEDRPEIVQAWTEYLSNEWQPWAEVDKRLKRIFSIYTELFSIYQRQQRLGEAYEVILGLGFLSWSTPSGQTVRRHLVTAQTALTFDPVRGIVSVGVAGEGARLQLEQDMLEAGERPDAEEQVAIERQIAEVGDAIWEGTHIFTELEAWVHAV